MNPAAPRLRPTRRQLVLLLLIAALYVAAVEWLCGWQRLSEAWSALPWRLVLAFVAAMLASYALRAWRLYLGARDVLPAGSYGTTLRLLWLHNAANLLLPARLGEFTLPWMLGRRFNVAWAHGGGLLVWLRVLDLHCVAALALAALALRLRHLLGPAWLAMAVAVAVLPLAFYLLRAPLAARLAARPRWRDALRAVPQGVPALLRDLALTWLAWLLKLAVFAAVLHVLAGAPAASAVLGAIGGDASTLLPLHAPAGAGTFEAGVLVGLGDGLSGDALRAAITLHLLLLGSALGGALLALPELPILMQGHDAAAH
ncbi:lysylphosphatidylglycerol synthase domain-containing protein [Solimonas flava]|uniref:lysylphosphatidylglycerol synthase domain-containing protein n=1 Tax=Solimonas flava TaxID=415849 RepID=UPI001378FA25|nr:lysylphosphatidylglycerol synthase domain-containing protein [Solimonas flava]